MSESFLHRYRLGNFEPMNWQWNVIENANVVNFLHCGARAGKSELAYCLTMNELFLGKRVLWIEGFKNHSFMYNECVSNKLKKIKLDKLLHSFHFGHGELSFLFLLRNKFQLAHLLNYHVIFIEQAELLNDYIFDVLYEWINDSSVKPRCRVFILGRAVSNLDTNYAKLASIGIPLPDGDFSDFKPIWEFKNKYCSTFRVPIQANPYLAEKDFSSIERGSPLVYKQEYLAKY